MFKHRVKIGALEVLPYPEPLLTGMTTLLAKTFAAPHDLPHPES